ncbi:MAG: LemA family protein [Gallionella sp.]|nr:LemA family protein [Gallionella sp.]
MSGFFSFIGGLIEFVLFLGVVIAVIAFMGYNGLRTLSESFREAMSNIGVVSNKQASLINQLIEVVKGYQESEKFVMLKVSDDMSQAGKAAQVYQQSNMVLSAASGIAQKFPELKTNEQYKRLIDSMQACEAQLECARQRYNGAVKEYNVKRSSIPTVFYAATLGFKVAPYLEFEGANQVIDMGTIKSFSSDDDGARLNALIGMAGSKVLEAGSKAIEGGRLIAGAAQEKIAQITKTDSADGGNVHVDHKSCATCGQAIRLGNVFCGGCGTKAAVG